MSPLVRGILMRIHLTDFSLVSDEDRRKRLDATQWLTVRTTVGR